MGRELVSRRGMSRRDLLKGLGFVAGGVILLDGCVVPSPPDRPLPTPGAPDVGPFPDGVMAGDPAPDGSVIWTRVLAPSGGAPVPVLWTVAEDASFATIAAGG